MADEFDPFDMELLRSLEAADAEAVLKADIELRKGAEPAQKQSVVRFTKVPAIWEETLAKARASGCTYRVAIVLLYEGWKAKLFSGQAVVKLTNVMLARVRVGRKGKKAALLVLRKIGLIGVEERGRKSPLVTVRFLD
jgi:hypothetical protein